ncbi:methyltransferase domain-containing protein [Parasphingorhabdus cellanae]|uniref:Methyltransferase domain-containing protein n=2 Tax=Parasphingorhabdus cellanae TaxID=2806553 RepID=A0ABX7T9Q7_9SPHN|nr:methyltransferase domain-containing protein [Parasphingorhabdus cellanae]
MKRNRILGSKGFQRWASRTPIVRAIARRRASAQFDMIAGFIYSQILVTIVESGLLEFLQSDVRSFADIVQKTGFSAAATDRLLRAGQSLDLIESPQEGVWTLGEAGAPLTANAGAIAMIRHHHLLYRDLADPLSLLHADRTEETGLSEFWSYASKAKNKSQSGPTGTTDYSQLMAATQPMVSEQICDGYDFSQHKKMLDIGGGSGGFILAVAAIAPDLHFGLFDLPDVIPQAQTRLQPLFLAERMAFHSGSFKADPVPENYDLITLIRILHDHDDNVVSALLPKIYQALPAGGRLMIVEPMAETKGAEKMGDAYFGFYLWAMRSGRPRSFSENRQMLLNAGFSAVREVKTNLPIITKALVADK